jgi:hypothetical protein
MALTSLSDALTLTSPLRNMLLAVASEAIRCGFAAMRHAPNVDDYPRALRAARASFVTLQRDGQLRGCIGSLEALRPLIEDVSRNAYAAAFEDPRFPALTPPEFEQLDIHISVLSTPEPLQFVTEADVLAQLRPLVDGVVLQEGSRRGTFLPSVWEQLPAPDEFWRHLKLKAGLPADYWSPTLVVMRYTVESVR